MIENTFSKIIKPLQGLKNRKGIQQQSKKFEEILKDRKQMEELEEGKLQPKAR
jgi:hypothetical protein